MFALFIPIGILKRGRTKQTNWNKFSQWPSRCKYSKSNSRQYSCPDPPNPYAPIHTIQPQKTKSDATCFHVHCPQSGHIEAPKTATAGSSPKWKQKKHTLTHRGGGSTNHSQGETERTWVGRQEPYQQERPPRRENRESASSVRYQSRKQGNREIPKPQARE